MNIRALQEMGATERQTSRYIPDEKVPVRQYFHSKTYQPMVGGDWDIDSDEDSTTDEWLKETNAAVRGRALCGCVENYYYVHFLTNFDL